MVRNLKKHSLTLQIQLNFLHLLSLLLNQEELLNESQDHYLSGEYRDTKEFHISGDLLVIYRIENETLELLRIGTHSQLFK